MHGAGFAIDAIKTLRNNRSLLKGKDAGHYKNFDTAYITDTIISRKAPVYKNASAQYLAHLKEQLKTDNKRSRIKKTLVFIVTCVATGSAMYFLLFA
ncbi:MAG: hypothetical protein RIE86_12370 [Imperialibacter sp.]|uniref:hypothetical protein n=1 Tax=Imperialibacter sp. TaxID=2038411 RepID=UPI0032EFB2D2